MVVVVVGGGFDADFGVWIVFDVVVVATPIELVFFG